MCVDTLVNDHDYANNGTNNKGHKNSVLLPFSSILRSPAFQWKAEKKNNSNMYVGMQTVLMS